MVTPDLAGAQGPPGTSALAGILQWMNRELRYKQIYLAPDRGWLPTAPQEVHRLRGGDCKDLAGFLNGAAKGAGLEAYPVLARVFTGTLDPDEPVNPFAFNHVVSAIGLEQTLGLASEVVTPQGRFLLVDPTSRFTPLGQLPFAHRGRKVLICTARDGWWVEVPAAATPDPKVEVRLDGDVGTLDAFKGTLVLREWQDALGLRATVLAGGAKPLKQALYRILQLAADAQLEVGPVADPLDGKEPYEVSLTFENPEGLAALGRQWLLPGIGLPAVQLPIQKLGVPRRSAVTTGNDRIWDFQARIRNLGPRAPVWTTRRLETPFRQVEWTAVAKDGVWNLHLVQRTQEITFPFERREEGVAQQRQDRNGLLTFLEEVMSVAVSDSGPSREPEQLVPGSQPR